MPVKVVVRRGPIPPGNAGPLLLAAVLVPVVLKAFKPLARTLGKGLSDLGKKLEDSAEDPHADARTEREQYESQFTAHQKVRREGDLRKEEQRVHEEDVPPVETASPTGQEEVEARLAEDVVSKGSAPKKAKPVAKKGKKGAGAGATNAKLDRPEKGGKAS